MQVFWPLDDDWYKGSITAYTEPTKKHSVSIPYLCSLFIKTYRASADYPFITP
jgi:hypothetical protein